MRSGDERFSVFTPSYSGDLERCRLLVDSVDRYLPPDVHHFLIVDHQDRRLFAPLRSSRVSLCDTEDFVPKGLRRLPFAPRIWVNLKGRPVRGWIVQQLVKLSVSDVTDSEGILLVDSDTFFVKPYDPSSDEVDGRMRLFRERNAALVTKVSEEWHRAAAERLGIQIDGPFDTGYVTGLVTWRRSNLVSLHDHLEGVHHRSWSQALVGAPTLSEYVLYGMFCDYVLGPRARHYPEPCINSLNYWGTAPKSRVELEELREAVGDHHVAVMVSAKSGTPIEDVREVFGFS